MSAFEKDDGYRFIFEKEYGCDGFAYSSNSSIIVLAALSLSFVVAALSA